MSFYYARNAFKTAWIAALVDHLIKNKKNKKELKKFKETSESRYIYKKQTR